MYLNIFKRKYYTLFRDVDRLVIRKNHMELVCMVSSKRNTFPSDIGLGVEFIYSYRFPSFDHNLKHLTPIRLKVNDILTRFIATNEMSSFNDAIFRTNVEILTNAIFSNCSQTLAVARHIS